MYRFFYEKLLCRIDAERAHKLAFGVIRSFGRGPLAAVGRSLTRPRTDMSVQALGTTFSTPFGLAAGFDKNAKGILGLGSLGFGHVEVGTVTARPQPGNPRPRLFRLLADRALINRMGFNNAGASRAAARVRAILAHPHRPVVGINIGKSRAVPVDEALDDYLASARSVAGVADYVVVNVSSPNTPGLRGLQELDQLAPLLDQVKAVVGSTPLLVKIAPDLTDVQLEKIAALAVRLSLAGIIAANTTISREGLATDSDTVQALGDGGLSGPQLAHRSIEMLRMLRTAVPNDMCIISVGGVETAHDVHERLAAGATLVQGYTAFVYQGPLWARRINRELAKLTR